MKILKNHAINGAVYGLATVGAIAGEYWGMHKLVYICKPLTMLVLSSWFFFNSRRVGDRFTLLIQIGLFLSLLGDTALMFQHRDAFFFLIGLGTLLVAHVCYTLAFAFNIADTPGGQGLLVSASIGLLVVGYVGAFGSMLLGHLEDGFAVPVGFYALASTIMCVAAALRFGRTYMASFIMVMLGAALLLASDSVLASARFIHPVMHAWWSVPLIYAVAQYLIARGCLRHVLDPEEIRRRAALNT